jgi:hypothetical protein
MAFNDTVSSSDFIALKPHFKMHLKTLMSLCKQWKCYFYKDSEKIPQNFFLHAQNIYWQELSLIINFEEKIGDEEYATL